MQKSWPPHESIAPYTPASGDIQVVPRKMLSFSSLNLRFSALESRGVRTSGGKHNNLCSRKLDGEYSGTTCITHDPQTKVLHRVGDNLPSDNLPRDSLYNSPVCYCKVLINMTTLFIYLFLKRRFQAPDSDYTRIIPSIPCHIYHNKETCNVQDPAYNLIGLGRFSYITL